VAIETYENQNREVFIWIYLRKMVDPNRKINRLVERDVNFLESCELEFAGRFTDEDSEFMAHCSKPLPEPPIVENWMGGGGGGFQGGGGGGGGGHGHGHHHNNRYNGNRRGGGDRGWQRRGGAGYHNNQDRGFRGRFPGSSVPIYS